MGKNRIASNIQWEHTNIKGVEKYYNYDWGIVAFEIARNRLNNKFTDIELSYNYIYLLIGNEGPVERYM